MSVTLTSYPRDTKFTTLRLGGKSLVINSITINLEERDTSGNVVRCNGTSVPTDASAGYAPGCIFRKTNGGVATTFYINEGTSSSSDFNAMETAASTVTAVVAGAGMTGGGTEGSVTLNVINTDGNITVTADSVDLAASINVAANLTWTKEVNHTSTVGATTTAATAGGNMSVTSGAGNTTGAGGSYTATAGAGGNDAVGGDAELKGGAAGGGNRAGGAAKLTGGAGTGTGAGGAITITSGASANGAGVSPGASGAITITPGVAGTATTGTAGAGGAINITGRTGGASTGAASTAGAGSDINITAGTGGNSSGGGDTSGRGGDVIQTSGNSGTGATPGRVGGIFRRSGDANKGAYYQGKPAPAAKTTNATLTVAEVLGGWITVNQGAAGTSTQTTPTGTALVAACPASLAAGDTFDFDVINISANNAELAVLAAGTDVTIVGNTTISANNAVTTQSQGTFRFRFTGGVTWVVYRVS